MRSGGGRRWQGGVWTGLLKRRGCVRASAVGHGRGDPAVLLVRLHQTLKGCFRFLAAEGLF